MDHRDTLLLVSPRFLFPVDSGGKIRTTQMLRGLKGGRFRIKLLSPATPLMANQFASELGTVCDEFAGWQPGFGGLWRQVAGAWHLLDQLPIPVRLDVSAEARQLLQSSLDRDKPAVVVFDFLHAAVLAPDKLGCASLLFTHNVESEIFLRHRDTSPSWPKRWLWANQYEKMLRFEAASLQRFDSVVAVSERDARFFADSFGVSGSHVVSTGVDLDFFSHAELQRPHDVVFCGSMDWLANQDAMRFFMDQVWPGIAQQVPEACMTVVGRTPPDSLVAAARDRGLLWRFTGFVDDVRSHMKGAAVSVVPLRIGGGTRLKIYESMAMGIPVVSTRIGVEGLPVSHGENCLIGDQPAEIAEAVVTLLRNASRRAALSRQARAFVEAHCGYQVAARQFESACVAAIETHAHGSPVR